jgi:hypothetical protein
MATDMTGAFTGQQKHAVYCWSATKPPRRADLNGVSGGLADTFGMATTQGVTLGRSRTMQVHVAYPKFGWEVATWLVTHAPSYGLHQVRFSGYQWTAAAGEHGWRRDASAPPAGNIELS